MDIVEGWMEEGSLWTKFEMSLWLKEQSEASQVDENACATSTNLLTWFSIVCTGE